jgi:CRISPR-associated protein Csd1
VLGLAPNAARVSVRFWHAAPLHEIARQIRQWFADLKVVRSAKDPEYPSLFRLLAACAQQGKADNIPPNLGGDIIRAILSCSPFPATWLNAAVLRCRAEQNVTYLRAAAIKASLNRLQRFQPNQSLDKELSDMLDLAGR